MTKQWTFRGKTFRQATPEEIAKLQALPSAPHVFYACLCGKGWWSAKNLTLTSGGQYNSCRNIFYLGDGPECDCPSSQLRCIVPVED